MASQVVPASHLQRVGWRTLSWLGRQSDPCWPNTPVLVLPPPRLHKEPKRVDTEKTTTVCACGATIKKQEYLRNHRHQRLRKHNQVCPNGHIAFDTYKRLFVDQGLQPADELANPSYWWLTTGIARNQLLDTIELSEIEKESLVPPLIPLADMCGLSAYDTDEDALICSYSKVGGQKDTYYVPGEPSAYTLAPDYITPDRIVNLKLELDQKIPQNERGDPLFDLVSSLDPIFRALDIMDPQFRFNDIDLIVDAPLVYSLLSWVNGLPQTVYRFAVSLVHNTVILTHENSNIRTAGEHARRADLFTAKPGLTFERFSTRAPEGLENTARSGHFRLIRHRIGPLACAIRYEADASYYPPGTAYPEPEPEPPATAAAKKPVTKKRKLGPGRAIRRGRVIPQSHIAELKVMKAESTEEAWIDWPQLRYAERILVQTWITRPAYIIGARYVKHGDIAAFHHSQIDDARGIRDMWQRRFTAQSNLRRFVVLLKRIRNVLARSRTKSCTLILTPTGVGGTDLHQKVLLFEHEPDATTTYISQEDIDAYWD